VQKARLVVGRAVAVVDLEEQLVARDPGEHHAVLVDAPAAEHAPRADAPERLEALQNEIDELGAAGHRGRLTGGPLSPHDRRRRRRPARGPWRTPARTWPASAARCSDCSGSSDSWVRASGR